MAHEAEPVVRAHEAAAVRAHETAAVELKEAGNRQDRVWYDESQR